MRPSTPHLDQVGDELNTLISWWLTQRHHGLYVAIGYTALFVFIAMVSYGLHTEAGIRRIALEEIKKLCR